jgi:hypothetical protein
VSDGRRKKLGFGAESRRRWVRQTTIDAGDHHGVNSCESERVRALQREVRDLREANAMRKDAAVFLSYGNSTLGDSLYPTVVDVAPDDFTAPLQLIARRLWFTDPLDQTPRDYTSRFALEWPDPASVNHAGETRRADHRID